MRKLLNWQVGENKVSFAQTSKGNWYCSELSIYCKDIFDGISMMDGAVDAVQTILNQRNMIKEIEE